MTPKYKIFLTFSQAIKDILDDFKFDPEQNELFAKVYSYLVGGKATPGEKECSPIGIKYGGIWHQPQGLEENIFYTWHDFQDVLSQAFKTNPPSEQDILKLYKMVTGLNAYIGAGPGKLKGIWGETEMEKFKCIQCGHCCLNMNDAYATSAYEEDIARWEEEKRWDILEYIDVGDLWVSPRTGEDVSRCPWLRKLPNKDKYICRIHHTKPKHCRDYPDSKKHAMRTGCKGFLVEKCARTEFRVKWMEK